MAQSGSSRIILAAILGILVYGMIAAMLGTILPTFALSMEQSGNVALAQAMGLVLASLAAGPLVDNKGKKPALLLALALIAGALFALPNVGNDYALVMTVLFVQGFGGGILVTAANMLAGDIDETKRASTLNFLNLFFGLGGMATPLISANLLANDAVRLCYLVAGLTVATLAVNFLAPIPGPSGDRGFKMSEAGELLGQPRLWLLALFLFLYVACEVGVWNWLVKYLITRGITESAAKNILGWGFALGLLIGRVVVSRILLRVPAMRVCLFAAALMLLTTNQMLNASSDRMAAIYVFLAGLAMAPIFPTTLAITGDLFRKGTATAMGIVITCGWIGLAVTSPIIGRIAGSGPTEDLRAGLMVLPVASAIMIIVMAILNRMPKKA